MSAAQRGSGTGVAARSAPAAPVRTGGRVSGHRKLLEQLQADGIRRIFGNPGSTEEGLLDELSRFPGIDYVMGLQEAAVICLADGHAQAAGDGRPAVALLHSGVGLGNAIGSLYHAMRRHTPMVVMVGEAGAAYEPMDAHMAADLVGMATPVTKYAVRAADSGSLLRLLRRCVKIASTPPYGPVLLAVPQDVLDRPNDEEVRPTSVPETRVTPVPELITQAGRLLAGARSPVIIVGDGIAASGAVPELVRFAELWGAEVWGAMASELLMPWDHPLFSGLTGHMFGEVSARTVADADAVLICGTYVFPDVFPLMTSPFRPDAAIVHVDLDSDAIAKNHPVTLGLVSDPKATLREFAAYLDRELTDEQRAGVAERTARLAGRKAATLEQQRRDDEARLGETPLHMAALARELREMLPADAILFDEALTNSPEVTRWLPPDTPGAFFQTPGGTLGVGFPGAIGAKLAHPDRTVVGLTGDGGLMYTLQALWTAAHHGIAAKLIVCHNASYRLLKENLVDYRRRESVDMPSSTSASAAAASAAGPGNALDERFPACFDISEPRIDTVGLAAALGVPGCRITTPEEIGPGLRRMLDHNGPFLVEAVLNRSVD